LFLATKKKKLEWLNHIGKLSTQEKFSLFPKLVEMTQYNKMNKEEVKEKNIINF
jgi:hypothetical protein